MPLLLLSIPAGCQAPPAPPADSRAAVLVNGHEVRVEISHTFEQRGQGLMHRTHLPEGDGMLFLYRYEAPRTFYMLNTRIPLDIAFFDGAGTLINVCSRQPAPDPSEGHRIRANSDRPAQFVLEVNHGWFAARGLIDEEGHPRDPVRLEMTESIRELAKRAD
ncbi:MAG: DUF192 domain-containing protein [Planctomycetes bacterium]|nr:DUF192 domain-containing protein [Planctomycetota bacterium]